MTSKTLETIAIAIIVILIAVLLFRELPSLLSGVLEKAAKTGTEQMLVRRVRL